MKVFISSLIGGFEQMRQAARDAITTLRHEPIMAEDFRPGPSSPQVACLSGVRDADLLILLLGERYGVKQSSGISATHEEYEDAKGKKPIIPFEQKGVSREADQEAFVREVLNWEGGSWRGEFTSRDDLREAVIRALHDFEMATAAGPVDKSAIQIKAKDLIEGSLRGSRQSHYGTLTVAVVGGPLQPVLRPAQIEDPLLKRALHQEAIFGDAAFFVAEKGVSASLEGSAIRLEQDRHAAITLDEEGSLLVQATIERESDTLMVLTEETVESRLARCLAYSTWALDHIDSTQKLTHVAIGVTIAAASHLTWRTRRENQMRPHSVSMNMFSGERPPIVVDRPRAALRLDRTRLVEDLVVLLRRQWKA